ncbi:MAG: YHS domain-containing protein [Acidobacteria bacterium]|nr:YHS domain-containing protein [Acidobacteriota bacterium]
MTRRLPIILVAMSIAVADAYAQHEGHQMAGMTASAASNPACAEGGRKALAIVEAASTRFESASRESGTAERLADLQRAVGAAQAQLFTCRAAVTRTPAAAPPADAMAGMDHSKMAMGKPAPGATPARPGAKPVDAMAGMDHSKMAMGKPAPGTKPAKPGAKPAEPMAGMDHSKMAMAGAPPKTSDDAAPAPGEAMLPVNMAERIADPACPDNVGQATAPKAVYERKVYYFCSTRTRDDFRKNPAAYLKKHPR